MENKEDLLQQVNAAITAVLAGGQSYKIGSRTMTRADLAELRAMRADLETQIGAGTGGGLLHGTCVAFFDGR